MKNILSAITFLALVGAISSTVSCTKKDSNELQINSPLKFVYDASLADGENVASLDKEQITASQLYSPSPALQEMEERMNKIVLIYVYEKGIEAAKNGDVKITYAFAEPKEDLKKLLGNKVNKAITVTFDETAKGFAAQLNDQKFTREDVAGQHMLMSRLMTDSFRQKIQALEGILSRREILRASKEANVSMEDFIRNTVMKGVPTPTDADLLAFAKKSNITEGEITEELKAQLKDTLLARQRDELITAYVAKNIIKSPIHVGFRKVNLKLEGINITPEMVPQKGTGPIEIILFANTQCEECKALTQAFSQFVPEDSKYFTLKYIFNFPESDNEERMVAEAAMCLKKQNEKMFWQFPQVMKKGQEPIEESINNAARASNADYDAFRTCFLAREFKTTLYAHLAQTQTLGFYTPPVVVLDGQVFEVPNAQDLFERAMDIKAEKGLGFNLFHNIKKMFGGH